MKLTRKNILLFLSPFAAVIAMLAIASLIATLSVVFFPTALYVIGGILIITGLSCMGFSAVHDFGDKD